MQKPQLANSDAIVKTLMPPQACCLMLATGLMFAWALPSLAQTTTLRDPLIQGAPYTAPNQAPAIGQPPPIGSGTTPVGVTPGMTSAVTDEPGVPYAPANQINITDSYIDIPIGAATLAAPGTLGPSLVGTVPVEPSTPGADPGELPAKNGYVPPAAWVNIQAGGGLGADQAPTKKWGGQTTRDYGQKPSTWDGRTWSTLTDYGDPLLQKPDLQTTPQVSQDGPRQATYPGQYNSTTNRVPNLPGAFEAQDLYGQRTLFNPIGSNTQAIPARQTLTTPEERNEQFTN